MIGYCYNSCISRIDEYIHRWIFCERGLKYPTQIIGKGCCGGKSYKLFIYKKVILTFQRDSIVENSSEEHGSG